MSRSALWRQENNVKEREQRGEDLFQTACAEGRSRGRNANVLPLWGPEDSFHFNPLLLRNTIQSPYFQKCCTKLTDWNSLVDEIYYEVKHVQPFQVDKTPSTAFCLLLRMLTLRMTAHQMDLTLKHVDSPFIRAVGFLYLRYAGVPEDTWKWIEPYLHDDEMIQVEQRSGSSIPMGEYVRRLFSERDYYGTPLPRLPVAVERDLQVKLLQAEEVVERAKLHFKNGSRMAHFQKLGSEVMALYGDEENPLTWYKAVVDRVITRDPESGASLKYPKFVVTFPEYGNTETVTLGEMDTLDGNWKRETPGAPRGSRDRGRGGRDLYQEVRRRERDTVTADRGWARRPPSTKNSLSHHSRTRTNPQDDYSPRSRPDRHRDGPTRPDNSRESPRQQHQQQRKRTPEEVAAVAEKKRKLMAKYG